MKKNIPKTTVDTRKPEGERCTGTGTIREIRKLFTKHKQEPMATFKIECKEKTMNAIIFPKEFEAYGSMIEEATTAQINGVVMQEDNGDRKLKVFEILTV